MAASLRLFVRSAPPPDGPTIVTVADYTAGVPKTLKLEFSAPVLPGTIPASAIVVDGIGTYRLYAQSGTHTGGSSVTRSLQTSVELTSGSPRASFLDPWIFTGADGLKVPTITDFPTT